MESILEGKLSPEFIQELKGVLNKPEYAADKAELKKAVEDAMEFPIVKMLLPDDKAAQIKKLFS